MSMTHLSQDRLKAMLTKPDDWKICTSAPNQGQPSDVNLLQHAPQHQSPGSSQTRSMTQRYETQDANAEDCLQETPTKFRGDAT